MKERYSIEIADIQLTILSDEPKDFVESTVAHLDETIRDMTVKNKRCSKLDAAILCALDFYSEKTKADKKLKNLEAQISLYEANIRRLKEEAEQLRAAAAPKAETAITTEEPVEEAKPAKASRRGNQIAIPEAGNAAGEKVASGYERLVAVGEMVMAFIRRSRDRDNKTLARFAEQLRQLLEKWEA